MGAGSSKSTVNQENISTIINEVIVQQAMNCSVVINTDQSINISGEDNVISNVEMVQGVQISASCFSSSISVNNMNTQIKEQIENLVKQSSGLKILSFDENVSSQTTKIMNNIQNVLNTSNLLNCATAVNNSQSINITGKRNIAKNIAMTQTVEAVRKCVMDQIMTNEMKNDIDVLAKTSSNLKGGLTLFDFEITPEVMAAIVIVIIALVLIAVFIYYIYSKKGSGLGTGSVSINLMQSPPQPQQFIPQFIPQQQPFLQQQQQNQYARAPPISQYGSMPPQYNSMSSQYSELPYANPLNEFIE